MPEAGQGDQYITHLRPFPLVFFNRFSLCNCFYRCILPKTIDYEIFN